MARARSAVAARWTILALVGVVPFWLAAPAWAQAPVVASPAAPTVTEGGSSTIVLQLTEPIIGPGPDPAVVSLTLAPDDPSRISLPDPTVTWAAVEWTQSRSLAVVAPDDGVDDSGGPITLRGVVDSGSDFYDGYAVTITVTVLDSAPSPTTSTSVVPPTSGSGSSGSVAPLSVMDAAGGATVPADELALTGAPDTALLLLGAAMVVGGLLVCGGARRRA